MPYPCKPEPEKGIASLMEKELIYNGKVLPGNRVPGCKITLCHEKATQDCERCGTPICNGHASMAVWEHICQWCRLVEWVEQVSRTF